MKLNGANFWLLSDIAVRNRAHVGCQEGPASLLSRSNHERINKSYLELNQIITILMAPVMKLECIWIIWKAEDPHSVQMDPHVFMFL